MQRGWRAATSRPRAPRGRRAPSRPRWRWSIKAGAARASSTATLSTRRQEAYRAGRGGVQDQRREEEEAAR
eukprot:5328756-Pyramimonas_sp.AAC.1